MNDIQVYSCKDKPILNYNTPSDASSNAQIYVSDLISKHTFRCKYIEFSFRSISLFRNCTVKLSYSTKLATLKTGHVYCFTYRGDTTT